MTLRITYTTYKTGLAHLPPQQQQELQQQQQGFRLPAESSVFSRCDYYTPRGQIYSVPKEQMHTLAHDLFRHFVCDFHFAETPALSTF